MTAQFFPFNPLASNPVRLAPAPIAAGAWLPVPLRIGPYRFAVSRTTREQMQHRTRLSESDINLQVIRLHHSLDGKRLIEYLLFEVIRLTHYVNGRKKASPIRFPPAWSNSCNAIRRPGPG